MQPADLAATEIDARLGALGFRRTTFKQFIHEVLNVSAGIEIGPVHALGSWDIKGD